MLRLEEQGKPNSETRDKKLSSKRMKEKRGEKLKFKRD